MIRKKISLVIITLLFWTACTSRQDASELPDAAPAFAANDQNGSLWKSEDHIGKSYMVIYFFPAAMTGG